MAEPKIINWNHVYLLGSEHGLTTWSGGENLPMVDVVVVLEPGKHMTYWYAWPDGAVMLPMPENLDQSGKVEYAHEHKGIWAFGWYYDKPFYRACRVCHGRADRNSINLFQVTIDCEPCNNTGKDPELAVPEDTTADWLEELGMLNTKAHAGTATDEEALRVGQLVFENVDDLINAAKAQRDGPSLITQGINYEVGQNLRENNDILKEKNDKLLGLIFKLRHGLSCWCEADEDPKLGRFHSALCIAAHDALND